MESDPLALDPPVYLLAAGMQAYYLPLSRMCNYAKHLSPLAMQSRLKVRDYENTLFALDNHHRPKLLPHSAASGLERSLEVDTSVAFAQHKLEQLAEEEQRQPASQQRLVPSIAWIDGPGIPGNFLVAC